MSINQTIRNLSLFFFLQGLQLQAQTPELIIRKGHDKPIHQITFSDNGEYLLTVGTDPTAKLWDPYSGNLLAELKGSGDPLESGSFSPNGKIVVTHSFQTSDYFFWESTSGKLLYALNKKQAHAIIAPAFNITGNLFAIGYADTNEALIYDIDGNIKTRLSGLSGKITSYAFSNDSILLCACKYPLDSTKKIYGTRYYLININNGQAIKSAESRTGVTNKLVLSHNGLFFLAGVEKVTMVPSVYDKISEYWNCFHLERKWAINRDYRDSRFSPDDKNILFGENVLQSEATEIAVNDTSQISHIAELGHFPQYSATGKFVITLQKLMHPNLDGGEDLYIILNDSINHYKSIYGSIKMTNSLNALAISKDENFLATGYSDGSFSIWDIGKKGLAEEINNTQNTIGSIQKFHYDELHNNFIISNNKEFLIKNATNLNKPIGIDLPIIYDESTSSPLLLEWGLKKSVYFSENNVFSIRNNKNGIQLIKNSPLRVVASLPSVDTLSYPPPNFNLTNGNFHAKNSFWNIDQEIDSLSISDHFLLPVNHSLKKRALLPGTYPILDSFTVIKVHRNKTTDRFMFRAQFDFSYNNENQTYTCIIGDSVMIFSLSDFSIKDRFLRPYLQSLVISDNGQFLLGIGLQENALYCFDVAKKSYVFKVPFQSETSKIGSIGTTLSSVVVSPDKTTFALTSRDENEVRLIDAITGKTLNTLSDHKGVIRGVEFSADGNSIFSCASDGCIKKWDSHTGKLLFTFMLFNNNNFAIILPDGYYYTSSKTDVRVLNFKIHNRIYNFSQFDLQYNRPDKVLRALGNNDTSLINNFYAAWQVRLRKSGLSELNTNDTKLAVPKTTVTRINNASYTRRPLYKLTLSFEDSIYSLKSYSVFVNNIPLNGMYGKKISQPGQKIIAEETVILSEGQNKIEISCTNEKSIESRKETVYVNYIPEKPKKAKTIFVGIGINQYEQYTKFKNLSYCVKDIRDLATAFREKIKDDLEIDTLIDFNATKENIKALRQKLMQTGIEDKVIVSFSGHGMVDNANGEFYFVTGKTDVNNPSVNGVSYADLEELLDGIPARKKLMLLDACHSGESNEYQSGSRKGIPGTRGYEDSITKMNLRGIDIAEEKPEKQAAKPFDIFKLMKDAFVDILRNNGAYVISAAQSNESALEKGSLSNGVFTHCLLELLKTKNAITINDLSIFINQCVSESTKGQQNIANRQELADYNWTLW